MRPNKLVFLSAATEEVCVKKQVLSLFAFMSVTILLAVFAVVRGYASTGTVSYALMATYASGAGLFWWSKKRNAGVQAEGSDKTSSSLIWLLASFTASAIVAVVQAIHEKWDIGDTIGLGFFVVFAAMSIYEALHRRRRKNSTE